MSIWQNIKDLFSDKNKNLNQFKNYGIDKIIMERLIKHELNRKPGISRDTAIEWALNRLRRDNR